MREPAAVAQQREPRGRRVRRGRRSARDGDGTGGAERDRTVDLLNAIQRPTCSEGANPLNRRQF